MTHPKPVMPRSGMALLMLAATTTQASTSLSLDDAVERSLVVSPRIQAAVELSQAAAARDGARLSLPDPEVELEWAGQASPGDFGSAAERSVGVTQRLAAPVAWHRGRSAARSTAAAIRLETVATARLDVTLETATAYLDLLLAERLLHLARRDFDLARELAHGARRRHEVGDTPPLAGLRADVEAGRVELAVGDGGDAVALARARLNALLNQDPRAVIELRDSLAAHEVALDSTALQERALSRRPEMAAASRRHDAARLEASAARARALPAVEVGLFRHDFAAAATPATWRWELAVEVPLWAASRQRHEVAAAAAQERQAAHVVEATRRLVRREVHAALLQVTAARRRLRSLEGALLREAEAAYAAARRSWEQGRVPQVEVLDARRTLTQAHGDHARAVHAHEVARHALARAVGVPLDGGEDR